MKSSRTHHAATRLLVLALTTSPALFACGDDEPTPSPEPEITPCTTDEECGAGRACDPAASPDADGCVATSPSSEPESTFCTTDEECGAGRACDPTASPDPDGCVALTPCATVLECATGQSCSAAGYCDDVVFPAQPEGATLPVFVLNGDRQGMAFFDFPYPSDLRLDADGTLSLAGIPVPTPDLPSAALYGGLIETAEQLRGFSHVPVAWFRFSAPLAERRFEDVIAAEAGSPIVLVNIDENSEFQGELIPVVAHTLPADPYTAENVLGVAPRPGFVLRPDTTYAFVVRRALNDATGAALGTASDFWLLANNGLPEGENGAAAVSLYSGLWPVLAQLEIALEDVAVATVFTTGDAPADLFDLTETVRTQHDGELTNIRVDDADGARHPGYCEILAELTVPQFQKGRPPFDDDGLFEFDTNGDPVVQREETFPVVITLPFSEGETMPAGGYPLAIYFHGSGGVAQQVIRRSPVDEEGNAARDRGPAYVLATHGIAAAGAALPISPDRVPGASSIAYLNFNNLKMFRDLFRQGAIEQRLMLDALLELRIEPSTVAECTGLALPDGETAYYFNPDAVMAMGQSMGGQYTNVVGTLDPRVQAVVPTGAGGYWSYFILETSLIANIPTLVAALLGTQAELTFMHPVLSALQQAWEPVEPMVYMPRLARRPLDGHPVRDVYVPVAAGDSYFPTVVFDAMALAYGHGQAGEEQEGWDTMQAALALAGIDGLADFPVRANVDSETGETYTGINVQHTPDGFSDPHDIFMQLSVARHQWGCFFETWLRDGEATVVPFADAGTACP